MPPTPLEMPEIAYPEGAKSDLTIIDVEVKLVITETGEIGKVDVTHGAGEPFDSAVVEGVRRFRFTPAMIHGEAASVVVPYIHHFLVPKPPPPPEEVEKGPKRDAVLLGMVQVRGTRATPAGVGVVVDVAGIELSALTDAKGLFRLEVPSGDLEVRVVGSEHRAFVQHEHLSPREELKVRYLIDRKSYDPYETIVTGTRERTEVSRTTLTGRELTKIPGTFGDPYRVITVLPGVTTLMTLLPYPIVRGSSPGNTGELLDGVRLGLLYHLLAGPAIIHPELIDRIDFYPGGFPVKYGGYTGGILDGLTRHTPDPEPKTELDIALTQAGVFLRRTYEPLGITATVSGRYGYPGALLSFVAPTISLSYWDYQARLDGNALGGAWTVFAYGARDHLEFGTVDAAGVTTWANLAMFVTHHLDLRFRVGSEDHERSARLVFMNDESQVQTGSSTGTLGVVPQLRLHEQFSPEFAFDAGLDGAIRQLSTIVPAATSGATTAASEALEPDGIVLSAGAFAQVVYKPVPTLVVIPGLRADVASDSTDTRASVDPRLLGRYQIRGGDFGQTWLKGVVGMYHQPPRLSLPLPGADEVKLSYELLGSLQTSVGAEVKLSPAVDVDIQTYYNANSPVLFDLSVNQSLGQVLNAPPTTAPGEQPPLSTRVNQADQTAQRLLATIDGRAYGVEVMLRKRDAKGFFGWVAYTLSKSERYIDGAWVPYDFDRRHILNIVGGLKLPRNWEIGARVLYQTGTPVTTIYGYNEGRTAPQFRFDVRVDKRAVWNNWLLDFYIDVINSTVAPETGGILGSASINYVLPTVGFRAVL